MADLDSLVTLFILSESLPEGETQLAVMYPDGHKLVRKDELPPPLNDLAINVGDLLVRYVNLLEKPFEARFHDTQILLVIAEVLTNNWLDEMTQLVEESFDEIVSLAEKC